MKNFLYSNLKNEIAKKNINKLKKMDLAGLIVDFECTEQLIEDLNKNDIRKNFYRIKLYEYDIENPDYTQIQKELEKAKNYGFYGFALDAEAYSNSDIWQKDQTKTFEFGEKLGKLIKKYFFNLMIYPENLGGEKYFNYNAWFMGVCKTNFNIKILTERTYEVWKPWEFFYIYKRIEKDQKISDNIDIIPGVWYESMSDFKFIINKLKTEKAIKIFNSTLWLRKILCIPCQFFQFLNTFFFRYRFYYSETTDFLNNIWLKILSN